jgi:lysophospholipase L1-like esterase
MKKLLKVSIALNLITLLLVGYLALYGKKHVRQIVFERLIYPRHEQKLSMFKACPETNGAIIFLGNSITEGGNWSELFPDLPVLNRGIGGDRTAGVLARMDEVLRHEPSKLFICIGTNDLGTNIPAEEVLHNYRSILELVQTTSPPTEIYVQSILPVGKKLILGHSNDKIIPFNTELQQLCAELGITYIDVFSELTNDEGYLDEKYSNDQLHLMGNAYLVWKEKIEPFIRD